MGVHDRLRVVEIIRPLKGGITKPYQCRLEDDRLYAVKGRGALAHGLLAEVCAATLGKGMGLPIPDFVIAEIPAVLTTATADPAISQALGEGTGFASLWQDAYETLTPTIRDNQNAAFLAKLYVFDHWIANGDRSLGDQDGNPNLLYDLARKKIIVFDHNLAFSANYEPSELAVHAGRRAWQAVGRSNGFMRRMSEIMAAARLEFNALVTELPEEWIDQCPEFVDTATRILDRFNVPQFWAELE